MSQPSQSSRRVPESTYTTEQVGDASWVARCALCPAQTAKKGSQRRTIGPIEDHIRVKHPESLTA